MIALAAFSLFILLHAWSYFVLRWAEILDRLPSPAVTLVYVLLGMIFFATWPAR